MFSRKRKAACAVILCVAALQKWHKDESEDDDGVETVKKPRSDETKHESFFDKLVNNIIVQRLLSELKYRFCR